MGFLIGLRFQFPQNAFSGVLQSSLGEQPQKRKHGTPRT